VCPMAVVPLNVHARTGGGVYFDRLGIHYGHMDKYIQDCWANSSRHTGE
jgi:hypothetical protein